MDENLKIFSFAEPEIEDFLHNNHVSLCERLKNEHLPVEEDYAKDPAADGEKDAVTIILATAALAVTLQPVLKKILEGLLYRPIRVTEVVPIEIPSNNNGSLTEGDHKSTKVAWVERTKIVENQPSKERVKVLAGLWGFKFEYDSNPGG
jgi:hypothetical protein